MRHGRLSMPAPSITSCRGSCPLQQAGQGEAHLLAQSHWPAATGTACCRYSHCSRRHGHHAWRCKAVEAIAPRVLPHISRHVDCRGGAGGAQRGRHAGCRAAWTRELRRRSATSRGGMPWRIRSNWFQTVDLSLAPAATGMGCRPSHAQPVLQHATAAHCLPATGMPSAASIWSSNQRVRMAILPSLNRRPLPSGAACRCTFLQWYGDSSTALCTASTF